MEAKSDLDKTAAGGLTFVNKSSNQIKRQEQDIWKQWYGQIRFLFETLFEWIEDF